MDSGFPEERIDAFTVGGWGVAGVAMLCEHPEVLVLWKCCRNGSIPEDFSGRFVEANEVSF
jgi:hypothetical protein